MTIRLCSASFCIEIESKSINLLSAFQKCRILPTLIPSIKISQENNNSNVSYKIMHMQESLNSIKAQDKVFFIHEIWSDEDIPGHIIFFIYKLFDHLYLSRNYLSFHSSAIAKNERGILLVGPAGSGKTGTMLHMALHRDYSFLSNNRTIVDTKTPSIIAGTSHISIRKEDLFRYQNIIQSPTQYTTVTGFQIMTPQEIGIKQTIGFPQPLAAIILIKITSDTNKFEKISPEVAIYKLHENISRTQWGEGLLFAGKKISPMLDTSDTAQQRLDLLRLLLEKIPCYEVCGSMQSIEQTIEKIIATQL